METSNNNPDSSSAPSSGSRPELVSNECGICIEPYNKRNRMLVKCPYCEYSACRTCCQTYILGETNVRCMNCAKEWTLHFLREAFTNSFLNTDLKTHREDVLFQQEVALLPATQPLVEREIARETIRSDIAKMNQEISELNVKVNSLWRKYNNIGNESVSANSTRAEFVRNCPDTDCRGFLSTQWKCGICAKWTCPTCHEVKGLDKNVEHTCNPDNVSTAQLLAHDTRHCPKCATPIFKIDGCDQMWCTQCHTGFSWRTGRIENSVHNPHYFEWLRRTRGTVDRAEGDFQCGRELTHQLSIEFERLLQRKIADVNGSIHDKSNRHPNALPTLDKVIGIIRSMIHVRAIDREKYDNNRLLENQDLRISYMRKHIQADRFKSLLQQRNKRIQKHTEIRNVIDIVLNTTTDILYRFREYLRNSPNTECDLHILDELDRIREYANDCLCDISYTYNSVLMQFNEKMRLYSGG